MKRLIILCLCCLGLFVCISPVVAEQNTIVKIEYALPYPGLLPDHPLYVVKRFRDYVFEQIIVEPIRKSEFYLLQADKRLQMGITLAEQKKYQLSETTISKAEKYLEKSMQLLVGQKSGKTPIPAYIVERLEKASAKHQEVIGELLIQIPTEQKTGLETSLQLVKKVQQEINTLK